MTISAKLEASMHNWFPLIRGTQSLGCHTSHFGRWVNKYFLRYKALSCFVMELWTSLDLLSSVAHLLSVTTSFWSFLSCMYASWGMDVWNMHQHNNILSDLVGRTPTSYLCHQAWLVYCHGYCGGGNPSRSLLTNDGFSSIVVWE